MWPYVLLIMLPLIMQSVKLSHKGILLVSVGHDETNQIAMKIFWLLLFMLLVLRHETIGIDLKNYTYIFRQISGSNWSKALGRSAEVGYSFVNKVVSLCTDDFRWIIIISALLEVWFIAKAYVEYSTDSALTISLFIIMSNFILLFSGLRQSIAISIGFLAFEYVRQRKIFAYLCIVFVAMLFHTSAFMLLFLYPLYYARITKKRLIFIVPILGILLIFNRQIFGVLTAILSMFTKYDAVITSTGAYTMLILFVMFAVFSYVIPDETQLDQDTIGMRNYLLFAIALQMFAPLHSLAMRMNYYYIAFIPLVIPRVIKCRRKRWNQVAIVARYVMIVFLIAYFLMFAPKDNSLHTFPYCFFWESII